MKKQLLFFVFISLSLSLWAQISITDINGNQINNDDTVTFNNDTEGLVTLITNSSANQIELRLKSVSITGARGDGMEFCIGACYYGMTEGAVYPDPAGTFHYYLDAGATSAETDVHFLHHIQDGDPKVTEYVLKIYEDGNEANNYVQFVYKYDANYVGIKDIKNLQISIYPNPATDYFTVTVPDNINESRIIISNILGKVEKNVLTDKNKGFFKTDGFSPGIYFVSVISDGLTIDTKKLIIR